MAWLAHNPSSIHFVAYHDMPKNPEGFCSKFNPRDPQRTAEEHIKIFETTVTEMQVDHKDVACRLFLHSLGEEAFYWYINLLRGSVTSWNLMKNAFLQKYKIPINPSELSRWFMSVRREVNEPIGSFNDHFHCAFTRLQDPYLHNDAAALPVYYAALDNLTSALVKRMHLPPPSLVTAYTEAIVASAYLG